MDEIHDKTSSIKEAFLRNPVPSHIIQTLSIIRENTSLAAPGALAHRLQHLPAHFIQNGPWGPGIGQTLGYWTLRSTFAK